MAPKWPGPVTCDDNRPSGFLQLHLKIPGMQLSGGVFQKTKMKNGSMVSSISPDNVTIRVNMDSGDEYLFTKSLPEDVDKAKSTVELKDERVIIKLAKVKDISWASHVPYLIKRE